MELRDKYPLTLWRNTSREMVRTFTVDPYVIDLELIKSILSACPTISEHRIIAHDAQPADVGYHISRVMDMALFSSNQQIKRLALVGNYDGAIVSVDVASSTPQLAGIWPMLRSEPIDADPFIHFANNAAGIDLSTPNIEIRNTAGNSHLVDDEFFAIGCPFYAHPMPFVESVSIRMLWTMPDI
ncbi:hypothetical protein BC940DRAFT_360504 [Gongronella butleri]|nr:hypothetical protein BC940DRAFT_360504 [Gongronella butleri]